MRDQIRGCVRISVRGRELYPFINDMHSGRIRCTGQYCRNDTFHGEIRRRDLPQVRRLAEAHGLTVSAAEYETVSTKLLRRRKRAGLAAGAAAVIAASVYFSGTVITVEVQGNRNVSTEVILSALSDIGIRRGARLSSIDYITAENKLMMNVEGLAWAGMHRTGSRIVVEVTEMTGKPDMVRKRMPCNIFSTRDARITGILVRDGMLMHCIGDSVKKGDLLVTGITSDDTGHTTLHHSMAEITGEYTDNVSFSGSSDTEETVFTGNEKAVRSLMLFGLDIPLFSGGNSFEEYSAEVTEHPLYVLGHRLPIGISCRIFREQHTAVIHLSEEELRRKLVDKMYLYERNFLKDTEIIGRQMDFSSDGKDMTLSVNYCLRGNICESREIMVKLPQQSPENHLTTDI